MIPSVAIKPSTIVRLPEHPDAVVNVPATPVYEKNRVAIDRFLGLESRSLAGVATANGPDVPNRFAPLLARLDATFRASTIPVKSRRVLTQERWFGRDYPLVAYTFSSAHHGRRHDRPALLVTAGIHGDEAGGVIGAAELMAKIAADPSFLERFAPIVFVPCANPVNIDLGTRELLDGRDPNRLFFTDDPTRPATVRALEILGTELAGQPDAVHLDLHQDDRYADDAIYALFDNNRSRASATAAVNGPANKTIVTSPIDAQDNDGGTLRRTYPGSFQLPVSNVDRPPIGVVIEANDSAAFVPAALAALEAI